MIYFLNKYPEGMGKHTSESVINLSIDKISKMIMEVMTDDATQIEPSLLLTYISQIKRM